MTRLPAAAFAGPVLLAGCAVSPVDAPSLLPRPIENVSFDEPEAKPVTIVPDPALDATIEEARQTLAAAASAFAEAVATVGPLVDAAEGTGIGSDAWLDAQVALARLDDARATSLATLSELDRLAIERGAAGKPAYPALEALRAEAQTQVRGESDQIDGFVDRLPPG
jgi:choline dehydrogenase-like flavoprotein